MNIFDVKQQIEQRAGVPGILLTGETAEELIAQAKAYLALKKQKEAQEAKEPREAFKDYMLDQAGEERQNPAAIALAEIETAAAQNPNKYPRIPDGGELNYSQVNQGTAKEQFAGFAESQLAFNPFKGAEGWQPTP